MILLTLSIQGPDLDTQCVLADGEPELTVGRDPQCDICLPDPQRNVSRKHLEMWTDQGTLHFRVTSSVNGVDLPSGEVPPGASAQLGSNDTLMVGDYALRIVGVTEHGAAAARPQADALPVATPAQSADPWDLLAEFAAPQFAPGPGSASAPASAADWQSPPLAQAVLQSTPPAPTSKSVTDTQRLRALLSGLGIAQELGQASPEQLEALGALLHAAAKGLLDLHERTQGGATDDQAQAAGAEHTMLVTRSSNPLMQAHSLQAKLQYLLLPGARSAALMAPSLALRELLQDLHAHDEATQAAVQALALGAIKEFEPDRLQQAVRAGSGPQLLGKARFWELYSKYYEGRSQELPQWTQQLVDRYFTGAYLRRKQSRRRAP